MMIVAVLSSHKTAMSTMVVDCRQVHSDSVGPFSPHDPVIELRTEDGQFYVPRV